MSTEFKSKTFVVVTVAVDFLVTGTVVVVFVLKGIHRPFARKQGRYVCVNKANEYTSDSSLSLSLARSLARSLEAVTTYTGWNVTQEY